VLRRHRAYSLLAASVWLPVLCFGARLAAQRLHRSIPTALSALMLLLLYKIPQYRLPLD
jgi:hypothetical protein